MTSSASGQDEPNSTLWLATRASKMERYCPLGIARFVPTITFRRCRSMCTGQFVGLICPVKRMVNEKNVCEARFLEMNWRIDPCTCWTIWAISSCAPENSLVTWTGFKPMTSPMPLQYSYQLSCEATHTWAGQFVGVMSSRERNDEWKKALKKIFRCKRDNCLNCLASAMVISSTLFWSDSWDLKGRLIHHKIQ